MEVEFNCVACSHPNQFESKKFSHEIVCNQCGKEYGAFSRFSDAEAGVRFCGICGCRDLYIQRDFNRKVGCAIAAIGAVLAPFTKLISLLICALIDLILYYSLPMIVICYRCGGIYREFPPNPQIQSFNLGINDRYRSAERSD